MSTGVQLHGGKFSSEQLAIYLDAGHRYFLKGFLFKMDKVPARLSFRERKVSQPEVIEGVVDSKFLSPEM